MAQNRPLAIRLAAQVALAAPNISMEPVPGDSVSDEVAFTGCYETGLTRRVIELARRGGTMIDVGANLGYSSLLRLSTNSSNRCIAFEAAPRNVEILRHNISRNGLDERAPTLQTQSNPSISGTKHLVTRANNVHRLLSNH